MRKRTILIKAGVSLLFLVFLFMHVRRGEFAAILHHIRLPAMALSFLVSAVMIAMSCAKWKVVLDHQNRRLPFGALMRHYMIGYYFSALLPSNVGGDVVRSYNVGNVIGSQARAAISIFIERVSGSLCLLLLVIAAPLMKQGLYGHLYIILPACGAVVLLAAVVWMWGIRNPFQLPDRIARAVFAGLRRALGRAGPLRRVIDRTESVYAGVHRHAESFHRKLMAAIGDLGGNRPALLKVIGLTLVYYGLTWVNVYMAFLTFDVRPDFIALSAVVPTAMLVSMLPVTLLGNLGFTEGVYVFYFGLAGPPEAAVLAAALFLRLKLIVTGTVGYGFYLAHRGPPVKLDELSGKLPET